MGVNLGILKFILSFLILVSSFPKPSLAGPRVNNGGGGWACLNHDAKKTRRWIRSADLVEAELNRLGIGAPEGIEAWKIFEEKIALISAQLPSIDALLGKHPLHLKSQVQMISTDLDTVPDTNLQARPHSSTCEGGTIEFVQIANFLINGNVPIAAGLWEDPAFTELEKAAILLHERIYHALRAEFGDENSVRTRALVGYIFSTLEFSKMREFVDYQVTDGYSGKDGEDYIAKFSVNLYCIASVESLIDQRTIGRRTWENKKFGKERSFHIEGFSFSIKTSGLDGVPELLLIENQLSGVSAELRDSEVRPQFIRAKRVGVSMRTRTPEPLVAQLACVHRK